MPSKVLDGGIPDFDDRAKKEYVPTELKGYLSASKNRHLFARQNTNVFYPSPAGYNDPLTHMCVIDVVMRLKPSDVIRAKYLWKLLQHTHPQVQWNSVVTGVALSEIATICEENFREKSLRPLISTRDFAGLKFKLQPTSEGWKWLETMRLFAAERAIEVQKEMRDGKMVRRQSSVWSDLPPRVNHDE